MKYSKAVSLERMDWEILEEVSKQKDWNLSKTLRIMIHIGYKELESMGMTEEERRSIENLINAEIQE